MICWVNGTQGETGTRLSGILPIGRNTVKPLDQKEILKWQSVAIMLFAFATVKVKALKQ